MVLVLAYQERFKGGSTAVGDNPEKAEVVRRIEEGDEEDRRKRGAEPGLNKGIGDADESVKVTSVLRRGKLVCHTHA